MALKQLRNSYIVRRGDFLGTIALSSSSVHMREICMVFSVPYGPGSTTLSARIGSKAYKALLREMMQSDQNATLGAIAAALNELAADDCNTTQKTG